MDYRVRHKTRYVYSNPVSLCHNEVRLIPANMPRQTVIGTPVFDIDPKPSARRERNDYFGNRVCYFAIQQTHKELSVVVASRVRVNAQPISDDPAPISWESARKRLSTPADPAHMNAYQFTLDSSLIASSEALRKYAAPSLTPGRPLAEAAHDLMRRIYRDFEFKPGFTTISTPLGEVLEHRRGVCQDFAQLAIGALRSMGLAARYVSGYLETMPPPGKPRLQGADVSHAWFSVYVPDTGWLDFDPTNDVIPSERHIVIAHGRDFSDVTPLKGVIFGSGGHDLQVSVDVERVEGNTGRGPK